MRIVKEGATISNVEIVNNCWKKVIRVEDTIEITATEWAIIEKEWHKEVYELGTYECPFPQYLHDLVALSIRK